MSTLVPLLVRASLSELGSRIALARRAREMNQAQLAHLSDVGLSTVVSLEAGHPGVSMGNLVKVISALGLLPQLNDLLDPRRDDQVTAFAQRQLERSSPRSSFS